MPFITLRMLSWDSNSFHSQLRSFGINSLNCISGCHMHKSRIWSGDSVLATKPPPPSIQHPRKCSLTVTQSISCVFELHVLPQTEDNKQSERCGVLFPFIKIIYESLNEYSPRQWIEYGCSKFWNLFCSFFHLLDYTKYVAPIVETNHKDNSGVRICVTLESATIHVLT
jgi:hypothetical protein